MKSQMPSSSPRLARPGTAVPLVTGREQVMGGEEPGPKPWTGRWMRRAEGRGRALGHGTQRAAWGPRPTIARTPNLLAATSGDSTKATAAHLFWSETVEDQEET